MHERRYADHRDHVDGELYDVIGAQRRLIHARRFRPEPKRTITQVTTRRRLPLVELAAEAHNDFR